MMNIIFKLLILFVCFIFTTKSKALDANGILHKRIVFKNNISINTEFDCFYEYSHNKIYSKKVFSKCGKYTNKNEILGHVFYVDSVVYINKHKDTSKGIYVLLKREDNTRIVLKTPSYNKDKEYSANNNNFSHSLIKSKYLGLKFDFKEHGLRDKYISYLDFDVYDITSADNNIEDLFKTNKIFSRDNIINLPQILNHSFIFEKQIPYYKLTFECEAKKYTIEELSALRDERNIQFKEALYVDSIIEANKNLKVDSLNKIYAGKDFWINPSLLSYSNLPIVHYTNYNSKDTCNKIDFIGGSIPRDNEWMYLNAKTYSEGMIGGDEWRFFKGRIEPICILPLVLPNRRYGQYDDYYRKKAEREKLPRYAYYLRIVPSPTYEYRLAYYDQKKTYGLDIRDTIYIPYDKNDFPYELAKCLLTDEMLKQFENDFNNMEEAAWKEHMNRTRGYIDVLTKAYGKETADLIAAGKIRFGFTTQMCKQAFVGEPYKEDSYVNTPLGIALRYDFFTKDIRLYFIDDKLIGIQWKGKAIEYYK